MPRSNVLQFKNSSPSDASLKAFAVFFYLALAYMMTLGGMGDGSFGLLAILAVLYALFVKKSPAVSHFRHNKDALVIGAVVLGAIIVLSLVSGSGGILVTLGVVAVISAIYWLLVGRSGKEAPYFLRFHLLTAMILDTFLMLLFMLLGALDGLLGAILQVLHLESVMAMASYGMVLLTLVAYWGTAIWLSISALTGRTPYIGLVTPNVRHWA